MSSKRKSLRYSQKRLDRLDYKREESANLRMKVLRSVLAVGVGFAMTPWLGGRPWQETLSHWRQVILCALVRRKI